MRNVLENNFNIVERPAHIVEKGYKSTEVYRQILATLDVLNGEKSIALTTKELPTKNMNYFKTYLKKLAARHSKTYRIAIAEDRGTVYIWKRDKFSNVS